MTALGQLAQLEAENRRLRSDLAEARAEIARLRAELDAGQGLPVYLAMDRDFPAVLATLADEGAAPGTKLRATDTGRELICCTGGVWLPP